MESIFKANEIQVDQEVYKYKGRLAQAEEKLSSLEEKCVMNEIEKDSYIFMKPKFKAEAVKLRDKLEEL